VDVVSAEESIFSAEAIKPGAVRIKPAGGGEEQRGAACRSATAVV
jgi:hypothetical protein